MIAIGFLLVILLQIGMAVELNKINAHHRGLKIFLDKRMQKVDK